MTKSRTLLLSIAAIALHAQPTASFEVASIRPITTIPRDPIFEITNTRFRVEVASLKFLIEKAYSVEDDHLAGPDWLATTRFDIDAKPPAGSSLNDLPKMLQSLLQERFHLRAHRELKSETVYLLRIGPDGSKLKEAAADNSADPGFLKNRLLLRRIGAEQGGFWTITRLNSDPQAALLFDGPRMSTAEFAGFLHDYVSYPVIDKTGLNGPFHFTLPVPQISRRPGAPAASPGEFGFVSIFDSVKALGLTLEKQSLPTDHLIVDSIDRIPSEN